MEGRIFNAALHFATGDHSGAASRNHGLAELARFDAANGSLTRRPSLSSSTGATPFASVTRSIIFFAYRPRHLRDDRDVVRELAVTTPGECIPGCA